MDTSNVEPIRQVKETKPDKIKITITTDLVTHAHFKAFAKEEGVTFEEMLKRMMHTYSTYKAAKAG